MRTCWLKVPEKLTTITLTIGSLIYSPSAYFRSSASIAGVLPTAGMSLISGIVMRPSGRTCTSTERSVLRHTKILSWSIGPITYSSPGPSRVATNEAGASCGRPPPPPMQPVSSSAAITGAAITLPKP